MKCHFFLFFFFLTSFLVGKNSYANFYSSSTIFIQSFFFSSSLLAVPFLNLMSNLEERAGAVVIRLGGNTQEFAAMVPSLPNGSTFSKGASNSTQTVSY